MLSALLGAAAFLLYLLYDINSFRWNRRIPRSFFLLGTLLLAAATALDFADALRRSAISGILDALLLVFAAASLLLLVYCLFFAIPFDATYSKQTTGRVVCDRGAYALCRHPGILCFFLFYLFLGLAALPAPLLGNGMLFSLLNLAYAAFQDRITFPKTFCNYETYRRQVPFLIPTPASVRAARHTFVHLHTKEDNS